MSPRTRPEAGTHAGCLARSGGVTMSGSQEHQQSCCPSGVCASGDEVGPAALGGQAVLERKIIRGA